jgi:putative transposase
VFVLKQAELGAPVSEVCRKLGISEQAFYRWKTKYAGMLPSDMKRLRQLEEENAKLKKLVADLSLDKVVLQDVLSKNGKACRLAGSGWVFENPLSRKRALLLSCLEDISFGLPQEAEEERAGLAENAGQGNCIGPGPAHPCVIEA